MLLLVAVLTVALLVVVITGEAGQTQGPGGSEPPSLSPGTAPTGRERALGLAAGSSEVEAPEAAPAQTYNASVRIPVAGLKPRISNVEWHVGGEGGCTYASSGDIYTWWSTPLFLPQGSTLRYFRMYYNDQNISVNCEAFLTVYDLYGRIVVEWGIQSSGTGMTHVTTPQLEHVVDYDYYSYVINWRPNDSGTDMQVCGFKVYYLKPPSMAYMPIVEKGN